MQVQFLVSICIGWREEPFILTCIIITCHPCFGHAIIAHPRFTRTTPFYKLLFTVSTYFRNNILLYKFRYFQTCIIISLYNLGIPWILFIKETNTRIPILYHKVNNSLTTGTSGKAITPMINTIVYIPFITGQTYFTFIKSYIFIQSIDITTRSTCHISCNLLGLTFILCQ